MQPSLWITTFLLGLCLAQSSLADGQNDDNAGWLRAQDARLRELFVTHSLGWNGQTARTVEARYHDEPDKKVELAVDMSQSEGPRRLVLWVDPVYSHFTESTLGDYPTLKVAIDFKDERDKAAFRYFLGVSANGFHISGINYKTHIDWKAIRQNRKNAPWYLEPDEPHLHIPYLSAWLNNRWESGQVRAEAGTIQIGEHSQSIQAVTEKVRKKLEQLNIDPLSETTEPYTTENRYRAAIELDKLFGLSREE